MILSLIIHDCGASLNQDQKILLIVQSILSETALLTAMPFHVVNVQKRYILPSYSIISFTCQFGHVPIFVWKVRSISQDERIFQKKPALAHLYVLLADDVTYIHHVAWNTLFTVLLNHTELLKLVSLVPLGSSLIILLFPVAQL